MQKIKTTLLLSLIGIFTISALSANINDTVYYELWDLNNLTSIGNHKVTVLGNPKIVNTEIGDAIQFDGEGDQIVIDFNPIKEAKEFTVELLFKPDTYSAANEAPRFVHIQDPNDPKNKRVMIELRVTKSNQCYMDGFMYTDKESLALINDTLLHETEVWNHVAITYKDSTLTTYFNGKKELSGTVRYTESLINSIGNTYLGARMNKVAYYKGLMKTFKVTHAALDPKDFIKIPDPVYYEQWEIDNLSNIGGHAVTVLGNPKVVTTKVGDAVQFDGDGDQLMVDFNPIKDAKEFTVEVIFKPDTTYATNKEAKFVHIQDPDDSAEKRVMIELQLNENNECYVDGFMRTDIEALSLINDTLVYPNKVWHNIAITYKDSIFTTYFDGEKQRSEILRYKDNIVNTIGKTSLGARMNESDYFVGFMKTLKVTHAALDPKDFLEIPVEPDTTTSIIASSKSDLNINLFPNPANGQLNIELSSSINQSNIDLRIFDLTGKTVYSKALDYSANENIRINTSNFNEGIYYVQIQAENSNNTKKLIIIHK